MEKPFTIRTMETEQKIVEIINTSKLPVHTLKTILQSIYSQLEKIDNEEMEKYKQSLIEESKKKESDK